MALAAATGSHSRSERCVRGLVPAALAAIELVAARRERGDFDLAYAERWAAQLGRTEALRRTLARTDDLAGSSGA